MEGEKRLEEVKTMMKMKTRMRVLVKPGMVVYIRDACENKLLLDFEDVFEDCL